MPMRCTDKLNMLYCMWYR